jgi:glutamate racemase
VRAETIVTFLLHQGAKAVVVACNTATGVAVAALRAQFAVPIVAIEPAVKPAVAQTKSGVVGVIATTQTLGGEKFATLVGTHAGHVRVLSQPCPGLVERVEAGDLSTAGTRALVERYVQPLLDQGADTIVLGCTHYPFLAEVIQEAVGPGVSVIDSAVPVARELRRRLAAAGLLVSESRPGGEQFWTTGRVSQVQTVIAQLWQSPLEVRALPPTVGAMPSASSQGR